MPGFINLWVLGIDMNGKKDVLGMYVGENESAKFWLSFMNGLKNRGVEDIPFILEQLPSYLGNKLGSNKSEVCEI